MWLCYSILLLCSTNVLNVEVPPSIRYLFSPQMPLRELDDSRSLVKEEYFTQRLDHFDPTNADVWQQRYFSCSKYYDKKGGNIAFLVVSDEEKVSSRCLDSGLVETLAAQYQARIFILEHRFFGASQPFKELYVENLRFLSSRQALEDAAMFITGINEKYDMQKSAQWVAVGCSYSGALAAWLKMKYPHLVRGAVASGAKILAKVDVPGFYNLVAKTFESYSKSCYIAIKKAFQQVRDLLDEETEEIVHILKLCHTVQNPFDIANLFRILTTMFGQTVQHENIKGSSTTIGGVCEIMTNGTTEDAVHRLGQLLELFYPYMGGCLSVRYSNDIIFLKMTHSDTARRYRAYLFQICTEFGWHFTSYEESNIFGEIPIDISGTLCEDVFGAQFNMSYIQDQVDRTNMHYGGLEIDVRNVVFVYGSYDPHMSIGITKNIHSTSPAIIIKGTSHCAEWYPYEKDEPKELTLARRRIIRLVGYWLKIKT